MLNEKIYENEDEREMYVKMAELSSEEIFSFVSDFVDVAIQGDLAKEISFDMVKLTKILENTKVNLPNHILLNYDTQIAKSITLQN